MASVHNDKQKKVNDEVKLVEYMQQTIRDGLLGRQEHVILGENPRQRFFSGVLFPNNEFIQQLAEDNENDPQPYYRSLSKNCNIGLEFLVKPKEKGVKLSVSGSFKLYPRLFPNFDEQIESLVYLEQPKK